MKTAMKLMLERIEFVFQQELKDEMQWWNNLKKGAIEMEKEQIINAYQQGHNDAGWTEDKYEPLEYYNQTYNQNK
jgi:hypothetical protein